MHQPESRYPEVWHQIVLSHILVNDKIPGKHVCPASMTKYPTPAVTLTRFAQDLMHFVRMMRKDEASGMIREILDGYPPGTSAQGPQGGRETDPPEDDPSWQRGGRADEDIPESAPLDGIEGRRPLGTNVPGGTGMASNAEVIAAINAARTKLSEALAQSEAAENAAQSAMFAARQNVHDAMVQIQAVNQGAESARLNSMVRAMADSVEGMETGVAVHGESNRGARTLMRAADDLGTEQIAAILG